MKLLPQFSILRTGDTTIEPKESEEPEDQPDIS